MYLASSPRLPVIKLYELSQVKSYFELCDWKSLPNLDIGFWLFTPKVISDLFYFVKRRRFVITNFFLLKSFRFRFQIYSDNSIFCLHHFLSLFYSNSSYAFRLCFQTETYFMFFVYISNSAFI